MPVCSGYLVAVGWQGSICSTAFLAGTIIQGIVILNHPTHSPQPYQDTLLVWAVMVLCVFFNVFLAKKLPFVEGVLLIVYVVGFFVVIIPLWVLAPRSPASEVFTTFNNDGGWSSKGVAVMICLGGVVPSLAGYDCAVHADQDKMAEEIEDASKTLPQSIVSGVALNGIMGLIMVITVCFTIGDTQSILSTIVPRGWEARLFAPLPCLYLADELIHFSMDDSTPAGVFLKPKPNDLLDLCPDGIQALKVGRH
ncbi:hypothetical protein LTR95_005511 [Oleoguttula sp. CCFEE 5521]